MSLHTLATHMAQTGRGPDSMLVHMSPREVESLQALAKATGGTLTINPHTGLPEAGFLDSFLPMLLGVGLSAFLGPEMMAIGEMFGAEGAAAGAIGAGVTVGGVESLATGSLSKGLMAGMGAYGGAGLAQSLAAAGVKQVAADELLKQGALKTGQEAAAATYGGWDIPGNVAPGEMLPPGAAATPAAAAPATPATPATPTTVTPTPDIYGSPAYNASTNTYEAFSPSSMPVAGAPPGTTWMPTEESLIGTGPGQITPEQYAKLASRSVTPEQIAAAKAGTPSAFDQMGAGFKNLKASDILNKGNMKYLGAAGTSLLAGMPQPTVNTPAKNLGGFHTGYYDPMTGRYVDTGGYIPYKDWGDKNIRNYTHAKNGGLMSLCGGGAVAFADGGEVDPNDISAIEAALAALQGQSEEARKAGRDQLLTTYDPNTLSQAPSLSQFGGYEQYATAAEEARQRLAGNTGSAGQGEGLDGLRTAQQQIVNPEAPTAAPQNPNGGNVTLGPYDPNAPAFKRDPGTTAQGYSRNYSSEELTNIAGTFDQYRNDPVKLMELMDQYGVSINDLALARSGSATPDTLRGYDNIFLQAGAKPGWGGMYTSKDLTADDKAFIDWKMAQPNGRGGTMADTYKEQGITDFYSDARLIADAKEQNARAQRRLDLYKESGQKEPTLYDRSGTDSGIKAWANPNWKQDMANRQSVLAARDAAQIAASPNVAGVQTPIATSGPNASAATSGSQFVAGGGGPMSQADYDRAVAVKKAQDAAEKAKLDAFQIAPGSRFYEYTQNPSLIPHFHNESDADALLRVKKNAMDEAEQQAGRYAYSKAYPDAASVVASGGLKDKDGKEMVPGPDETHSVITLKDGTARFITKAEAANENQIRQQWLVDNGYTAKTDTPSTSTATGIQTVAPRAAANTDAPASGIQQLTRNGHAVDPTTGHLINPTLDAATLKMTRDGINTNAEMKQAYDGYWNTVKPGDVLDFAGGTLTMNADGTATHKYTDARGNEKSYTFSRSTDFATVAKADPNIATEWKNMFNYVPPSSTGWTPPTPPDTRVPKTIEEFNTRFNHLTGDSAAMYNYLMGKGPEPKGTTNPEVMKPYWEAMGLAPVDKTRSSRIYNPITKKYEANPDFVPKVLDPVTKRLVPAITATDNKDKKPTITPDNGKEWTWDTDKKQWMQTPITITSAVDSGTNSSAKGGVIGYAGGGLGSLGGYSDGGRLLKGPGDGVSDSIPASIGNRQPARLADGEFVVPARIVSELGNGSTEAGARRLYQMMDRVQNARKQSIGKNKVATDSRAEKYLPA